MNTYGMHSIHGRAPAIATGLATSRDPTCRCWVVTGDGDALSIGGNHLIHALRRNVNLKILLFNNRIYGLTKGQYSPTSEVGKITKSTPMGSLDHPFNPVSLALGAEASFVARTIDSDRKHLTAVLRAAAAHHGTSFVEIYQNCNDLQRRRVRRAEGAGDPRRRDHPPGARRADPVRARGLARAGPRPGHRRRQGRRGRRRPRPGRRRPPAGARRPRRRPDDRVRDLAAHRRGAAPPGADRDLPPGRPTDVRRPRPRPDRPGLGRRQRLRRRTGSPP